MKIALISTPWIAVPPIGYGGTEAVVYNLTEGLVKKGHDVTLLSTGDSKVSAKLAYYYPQALGNNLHLKTNPYYQINHLFHFFKNVLPKGFDIVHNHDSRLTAYFFELSNVPYVHTLHGCYSTTMDDPSGSNNAARETMLKFKHHPYVSISNRQRLDIPELNFVATVYNSLVLNDYLFSENGGESIIWLGRVSSSKGIENLIKTVSTVNRPLIISIFIDEGEKEYFNHSIAPLLNSSLIKTVPEIKNKENKNNLFGEGRLFLFPITWDEPFGLVMIEAMACGTPVVAFARGSVPEIVKDGETGFIVNPSNEDIRGDFIVKKTGIEGLCEAVERIYSLPEDQYKQMRRNCRAHVEANFTVEKMVNGYEKVYEQILGSK